jgi:hypothetical protein
MAMVRIFEVMFEAFKHGDGAHFENMSGQTQNHSV